jgi:hypothetical protein
MENYHECMNNEGFVWREESSAWFALFSGVESAFRHYTWVRAGDDLTAVRLLANAVQTHKVAPDASKQSSILSNASLVMES